jgi:flavin reductase (DIM6/NTAB) family NADH-FMN oxidoreductase RutF
MSQVASPVSVITTMTDTGPRGTTVSAFCSLSMDPPMFMGALERSSELLGAITVTSRFGVNVLAADQSEIALSFASKLGSEKFTGTEWSLEHGVPRIGGALGWLVCDVADLLAGGDHIIVVGTVCRAENSPSRPLIYHDRGFGTCSDLANV